MTERDQEYDIFFCYKSEDATAAENLRSALVGEGLKVFLDVIEGPLWDPLSTSIIRALRRSRALLALITPRFPISPHCREELHSALTAAYYLDAGDTSRVMAVTQDVSPEVVRPRQLTAYRLPRDGIPPHELVAKIVQHVEKLDGRRFGDAPTPPEPQWFPHELPGDKLFRGRYAEMWELHEGLRAREKNRDRGHSVVAVSGLGGLGKTALCLQYARLFQLDHPGGVFVFRLEGSADQGKVSDNLIWARYQDQLGMVARRLGASGSDDVYAKLEERGSDYLWILDDMPAAASKEMLARLCAPTGRGKTLITTRGRFQGRASEVFELCPLGVEVSREVLTAHHKPTPLDRKTVLDIVELLGGHPLGLSLAAGLTTLPAFTGYRALLEDLSSTEPDHLEIASQIERELPAGCARPFSNALLGSFSSVGGTTKEVLCAASVLAPTLIPFDLLTGIARRAGVLDSESTASGLRAAAERGLIDLAANMACVMHALVARAIRIRVETAGRRVRLRNAALAELTHAVEGTRNAYRHRDVAYFLPHVRAVAGLLLGGERWGIDEDERHLLNETGRTQVESGDTKSALATYQALHAAIKNLDAADTYTRYVVLNGLAVAHELEGNYSLAARLKEQVAEGLAGELGADDPDAVTALNNLAVCHLALGNYEQAHALAREVYVRRRGNQQLGPMHRETLIALNNLAITRGHLGGTPAERHRNRHIAHRYWLGSRECWRKIAGPDDQYALDVCNGLALSFRALGMPDQALEVMRDLYRRRAQLLGPDHPDTLGTVENLLILREELGDESR